MRKPDAVDVGARAVIAALIVRLGGSVSLSDEEVLAAADMRLVASGGGTFRVLERKNQENA